MLKKKRLNAFQSISLGFLTVMLIGAFLLMLPISSASGEWTSLLNALFTSTSATCVTGLVVYDTATHWSMFGQLVILILIQIGGLGVISFTGYILLLFGKKIGLDERNKMQTAISAPSLQGIVKMTIFILKVTALVEGTCAVLLSIRFIPDFGFLKGVWYSIFHSISAFCNAGFDLMGIQSPFSSLTGYQDSALVNLVIISLILIGGIGFTTWDDFKQHRYHFQKYRLQTKIVLVSSAVLIGIPALYFFTFEFADAPLKERILNSLFQTITPRTAGFNTVDLNALDDSGQLIIILLMLVGGASGSTAGGMKITTIAVLAMSVISVFHQREDVECFNRRIVSSQVQTAAAVLMIYLTLFLFGGIFICLADGVRLMEALFESASAIATVGLTLGITPNLCTASKIVLIMMMYLGRIGGLTFAYATINRLKKEQGKLPKEEIAIG